MALLKTFFLPKKLCEIAIWNISENLDELRTLSVKLNGINAISDDFKAPSRKKQFLASRLALNKMIGAANIIYTNTGAPFLAGDKRFVSISHSNEMAAVIVGTKKVGIDIEKVSMKIEKIATKFMHVSEFSFAESTLAKTICWCVKEALYKLNGGGKIIFTEDIIVANFDIKPKGTLTAKLKNESYYLYYELIDEFVLVYVAN